MLNTSPLTPTPGSSPSNWRKEPRPHAVQRPSRPPSEGSPSSVWYTNDVPERIRPGSSPRRTLSDPPVEVSLHWFSHRWFPRAPARPNVENGSNPNRKWEPGPPIPAKRPATAFTTWVATVRPKRDAQASATIALSSSSRIIPVGSGTGSPESRGFLTVIVKSSSTSSIVSSTMVTGIVRRVSPASKTSVPALRR